MPTQSIMTVGGGIGRSSPDMLVTPKSTGEGVAPEAIDPASLPMMGIKLTDYCNTPRFHELDRKESYFRTKQDDHKRYDWDGNLMGSDGAPIEPGWTVPYRLRKPCARYHLARLIVKRFSGLLFGTGHFPEVRIEGDPDAEDYAKELAKVSRLQARFMEGRDLGGAVGSVCLSFAFVDGLPRVRVHNAKHVEILRWIDESEHIVGAALEAYSYTRMVRDQGKLKEKTFFRVRYWDTEREILWEPIPQNVAEQPTWPLWRHSETFHGFGFTPFYFIQNLPDSCELDGDSDYEGTLEDLDEINQVLSGLVKGTKVNNDPTLVIHDDPSMNTGVVRKGTGNAIYSKGGAAYLEISGTSAKASIDVLERQRTYVLDVVGAVLADPDKLSGAAQSAKALEILFAPMLVQLDKLREQYGEYGIKIVLRDMLRAAKVLGSREPMNTGLIDATGAPVLIKFGVTLPPKVETTVDGAGTETMTLTERTPGENENVTLNWNPPFPPTWQDIQVASTAAVAASGQKPVISQRTAVQAVQTLWGVTNADLELKQIEEDSEKALENAQRAFGEAGAFGAPKPKTTDEDEADVADEE